MSTNLIIIYLTFILHFSKSFDYTFYITSDQEICIDDKCQQTHFSEISLGTGSSACFIDFDGLQTVYTVKSILTHNIYKPIYYSCDYHQVPSCVYRCAGAGKCTTNECHPNTFQDYEGPSYH